MNTQIFVGPVSLQVSFELSRVAMASYGKWDWGRHEDKTAHVCP